MRSVKIFVLPCIDPLYLLCIDKKEANVHVDVVKMCYHLLGHTNNVWFHTRGVLMDGMR